MLIHNYYLYDGITRTTVTSTGRAESTLNSSDILKGNVCLILIISCILCLSC
jgi:hypothetical protein